MKYKLLKNESLEEIHHCFIEAFSDYVVNIQLAFEKFCRLIRRNGVDLRFSIGAYDGDTLVGFILNGVGMWNKKKTVYDSGTGVIKEYRGRKYSKNMFEVLRKNLKNEFSQYLLEVIQINIPAFNLYSRLGFAIERELSCFTLKKENLPPIQTDLYEFRTLSSIKWNVLETFWNYRPFWQNSIHAVECIADQLEKVGCYSDTECIGYGIFDLKSGEIVHIAIKKDMRRKGIGSMLLNHIAGETEAENLRIVNIDKRDRETVGFLEKNGFVNDINQYEMILDLQKK